MILLIALNNKRICNVVINNVISKVFVCIVVASSKCVSKLERIQPINKKK